MHSFHTPTHTHSLAPPTCMYTRTCTPNTYTQTHTYTHTHTHTCTTHTHMHTHTHAHTHTHRHTFTHSHTHTHTHTHTHKSTYMRTSTHTHKHNPLACTHLHTTTHTPIHTHPSAQKPLADSWYFPANFTGVKLANPNISTTNFVQDTSQTSVSVSHIHSSSLEQVDTPRTCTCALGMDSNYDHQILFPLFKRVWEQDWLSLETMDHRLLKL